MNDQFDDLAKGLAQSITRRGALKKFGLGLAGIALAAMGLTNKAQAARGNCAQHCAHYCKKFPDDYYGCYSNCLDQCKHSPI